jgi:hypothetical protein
LDLFDDAELVGNALGKRRLARAEIAVEQDDVPRLQ